MLIILIFTVIGIVVTYFGMKYEYQGSFSYGETFLARLAVVVWWLALCAIVGSTRFGNGIELEKLRVFATVDRPNIELAIEKTTDYLNEIDKTEWGIEKVALYQKASDGIGELVEHVFQYNQLLTGYLIYKRNPWTSWFVPSIEGLELIKFKSFN